VHKWLISNSVSSAGMHVLKRLMVNHNTPRLSKFCLDRFLIFVLICCRVTFKFRVFQAVDRLYHRAYIFFAPVDVYFNELISLCI